MYDTDTSSYMCELLRSRVPICYKITVLVVLV